MLRSSMDLKVMPRSTGRHKNILVIIAKGIRYLTSVEAHFANIDNKTIIIMMIVL